MKVMWEVRSENRTSRQSLQRADIYMRDTHSPLQLEHDKAQLGKHLHPRQPPRTAHGLDWQVGGRSIVNEGSWWLLTTSVSSKEICPIHFGFDFMKGILTVWQNLAKIDLRFYYRQQSGSRLYVNNITCLLCSMFIFSVAEDNSKMTEKILAILHKQKMVRRLMDDFTVNYPPHLMEFVWFEVYKCFK